MDQAIVDFTSGKRIAVVGVSRKSTGFGRMAYKELAQRGYQVYAVNREAQDIDGAPCYPDLAPLAGQVDGVLVVVPPKDGAGVLRQAAELGIHNVWLQMGAESPELVVLAQELVRHIHNHGLQVAHRHAERLDVDPDAVGVHNLNVGLDG